VISLSRELKKLGLQVYIGSRYIGCELRSAPPNATDVELARDLGYSACRYLLSNGNGEVITFKGGFPHSIPLQSMMDVKSGQTIIRFVDKTTSYYEVAQKYQIRLTKKDVEDPSFLHALQDQFRLSPQDFVTRFSRIAQ
jgi:6-phosphofructokinase 1